MVCENFRFQAHRGDSADYPENTLTAYSAAVREGYRLIEADTKFTADGVCIMLHDGTLNRTCRTASGGKLPERVSASSWTLAQISELDAGLFRGEEFRGTRVPTLAETLSLLRGTGVVLKLDNVFESFDEACFETFCCTVAEADMEEQIAFTCKTMPYFSYLAEKFPRAEMHYDGMLTEEALSSAARLAGDRLTVWIPYDNEATAWFRGRKADEAFCRELHRYGKVGIWLLSTEEELDDAVNRFGADAIETNGTLKPSALAHI